MRVEPDTETLGIQLEIAAENLEQAFVGEPPVLAARLLQHQRAQRLLEWG